MDNPTEVTIDGVRYMRADTQGPIKIAVLERGFVYIGRVDQVDGEIVIRGARSLIRWGTSKHLGELYSGPLPNTRLGAACTVRARLQQLIHVIEVDEHAWCEHING